ncbi:class I SAM-dependent DNA methyltransferase [Caldisalinibacter kiritimatiensis]|uniref:Methyltransferase n=1 Tax=Caldisalinibacter kiritimatiensis TaxID=1304284 RepID=R1CQF9_9FIRM|nr:class I SAM-dependent methyltransferase [Caldisalinibacter kiritimatiensis]EOD00906.1 Methyltransferase [Caldisalinibacter kiritimatiensis]
MEAYKEFAYIYDELMNDVEYKTWFEYIKEIIKTKNIKGKKVLEMACGTGNFTEYLCNEGYDVTCFDISQEMLTIAYQKLRKYRNVTILNQDMTEFKLKDKFDVIVSICDSINYITDLKNLHKVFSNVYEHLNEGGIFIFDINSYYKLKNIIGNNVFVDENEKVFYVWENYYDNNLDVCEFYLNFFVKECDRYKRFEEKHLQKAYRSEEIINALKLAKFNTIDVYDAFTFKAPTNNSERINFIAKK